MGVIATNLFDVGNSFICLGGSYCIASSVKDGTGFSLKRIAKSAVTSVALMTHFLMVALNLAGLTLPKSILSLAELIGSANSVLAMLMLGVGMNLSGGSSRMRYIAKHLVIRYSMAAVFAAAFYFLLPFALEVRRALVILAFSPFASATPVFTEELREDRELSATINSFSVVCSIVIIIGLLMLML
jgi:predicted permease